MRRAPAESGRPIGQRPPKPEAAVGADGNTADGATLAALRPVLLGLARLQLRNEARAEDVVSETLLAAVEGWAGFDQRSQLKTWVVGILKHKIIDQFRRNSREVSLEAQQEIDSGENLDETFDATGHRLHDPISWGDPEAALQQAQFFTVLQACVDDLPAPLARIFLLREWLEMETSAICKEMTLSSTNCFVMLYRARMRLRECLEARWFAAGGAGHG